MCINRQFYSVFIVGLIFLFSTGVLAQRYGEASGLSAMGPQSSGSTEFENFDEVQLIKDSLRPINRV